jgi:hypothetical protein
MAKKKSRKVAKKVTGKDAASAAYKASRKDQRTKKKAPKRKAAKKKASKVVAGKLPKRLPKKRKPPGRPRVITVVKRDRILKLLSIGSSRGMAAKAVGIHITTIADEARRNKPFSDSLDIAETAGYEMCLQQVTDAAKSGDIKVAQWYLARRHKEEWGTLQKLAMTDSEGKDLTAAERRRAVNSVLIERFGDDAAFLTEGQDDDD